MARRYRGGRKPPPPPKPDEVTPQPPPIQRGPPDVTPGVPVRRGPVSVVPPGHTRRPSPERNDMQPHVGTVAEEVSPDENLRLRRLRGGGGSASVKVFR